MKPQAKVFLISFFVSSIVYTGLTAAFDYYLDEKVYPVKLAIGFVFFGTFMALVNNYSYKKQQQKKEEK